ncbi:DUF2206 domain-containing protein [Methanoculleus taiwanensis]|uniref:DUF2206 domain-containing protein n=1 Tax=Methanoculleus taiwanensis TaxID=1550565 RepID=UPI001F4F9057|nr:DUF2206 domain-containing protein [Methanoculleus taiwanensis]
MVIFANNINTIQKRVFFILFALSLILSHYGTSYLFFISLLFVYIFILIFDKLCNSRRAMLTAAQDRINIGGVKRLFLNPYLLCLYLLISVVWYIYISGSSTFDTICGMASFAFNNLSTEMFGFETSRGLYLATKSLGSPLHSILRILYVITQLFIFTGILYFIIYEKGKKDITLVAFSISFAIILIFGLISQNFSAMDPRRLYHFCLYILAPFSVIGGLALLNLISNKAKLNPISTGVFSPLRIIYMFFIIFFLFNTGFIYEIAKDHPNSISLSQKTIQEHGDEDDKAYLYMSLIEPHNVYSGSWITNNMKSQDDKVYRGDWVEGYPSLTVYGNLKDDGLRTLFNMEGHNIKHFDQSTVEIDRGYVQITYANLVWGVGWNWDNPLKQRTTFRFEEINLSLHNMSKIYDNAGSEILWNR